MTANIFIIIFIISTIIMLSFAVIISIFPYWIIDDMPKVPVWDVLHENRKQLYQKLECATFGGDFDEKTKICKPGEYFQKPNGLDINWNYDLKKWQKYYSGYSTSGSDESQCNDGFTYIQTDWPEDFPTCVNIDYYNSKTCDENWELKWYSSHTGCTPIPKHEIIIKNQEKLIDLLENEQ